MMLRIFRVDKGYGYVIDKQGNRLYYGTIYGCKKFIRVMMKEGVQDDRSEEADKRYTRM